MINGPGYALSPSAYENDDDRWIWGVDMIQVDQDMLLARIDPAEAAGRVTRSMPPACNRSCAVVGAPQAKDRFELSPRPSDHAIDAVP